jgi:hypothetical protein
MAHIKGAPRGLTFTPDKDGDGSGWLEWDEVLVRKGFRNKIIHRRVRKEAAKHDDVAAAA